MEESMWEMILKTTFHNMESLGKYKFPIHLMIQVDISGHTPLPVGSHTSFILAVTIFILVIFF
jgi:hypothetical protein